MLIIFSTKLFDFVKYMPIEYGVQILTTMTCLLNGNYFFFVCQVPLALFHGKQLASKGYKAYAVTRDEYK